MALIGKIRKNFWFVLILLGLALAAFLIMDTSAGNPGGQTNTNLGSVNGQKIDYNDFQRTEQAYFQNAQIDPFVKKNTVWNYYVENALLKKEGQALGLNVPKDELMDLQFGATPSPIITQNQWQATDLQNIQKTLLDGDEIRPEFEAYWGEQEKQIINDRLKTKLNNLISKSIYTPSWLAEESFSSENTKVDFKYVKIPFDQIPADGVQVTDADINNYVSSRNDEFAQDEETRIGEFVSFNVMPSAADTALWLEKANEQKTNFINTLNDSLFVTSNKGYYTHLYNKLDALPESAQNALRSLSPGEMYGPFEEGGSYLVMKLIDRKIVPDSVEAHHILKAANPADPASFAVAEAFIDSLERVYKRGGVSFDTLAVRHTDDRASIPNGGKYENFPQEQMVPEFTRACFIDGKRGDIFKVRTTYGIHLIKVGKQTFNDRDPKYKFASVSTNIVPSQETQDTKYDEVTELVARTKDIGALKEALTKYPGIVLEDTPAVNTNDYTLGSLGSGQTPRDMIKWLFDVSNEIGDVSQDVYRFSDPVKYYDNKYVLMALKSIVPEGLPPMATLRSQVETAVMNQKKGESMASGLSVSSLADVASKYGGTVETATDVTATRAFVPGVGNEPDVIGTAFELGAQALSKPIVGESGVFVLEGVRKMDAGAANNIPFLKTNLSTSTKSQVSFKILENMKKRAEISDSRSKFF